MDREEDLSTMSPLTSGRSLGEPLECYDPNSVDCKSRHLSPEVEALRRRRPLEPYAYRMDVEDDVRDDMFSAMWREHIHVFEYIEREAYRFEEVLKGFWYFEPRTPEQDPEDLEERVLGYCDKYGLHLAFLRGADRLFNGHLDIALKLETKLVRVEDEPKALNERCVLRNYEDKCDKDVFEVHEDTKRMMSLGGVPPILSDVGYGIARKLVAEIGLNFEEQSDYYGCREEWEYLLQEWISRMQVYFRMSIKLVTHALPHLDAFFPSLLIICSEIVKEAQRYEKTKITEREPRQQMISDMEDSVFGLAFDVVFAAAKAIMKTEDIVFKGGTVGSEEGMRNRHRANMIWAFFLLPLRREWKKREADLLTMSIQVKPEVELVVGEFVGRRISELISLLAQAKDTDSFFLDMCKPEDDGGLLLNTLSLMARPKKLVLGETVAKQARAVGLIVDHICVYECPDQLNVTMTTLRSLYIMGAMADINPVNRSQAKSSVMWALSKFWDVVADVHANEVIGSNATSLEYINLYETVFMTDGNFFNYSFCRSLGGLYRWLPAPLLEYPNVVTMIHTSLEKMCMQLCHSTDFKLRWNVAYAVGCCFGNENIFRVMEGTVMEVALVPMCTTIRRSQNFKERIQALLAFGKLMRGPALSSSMGYLLESLCVSIRTLPYDAHTQHAHTLKFKIEVASALCHVLSILEPQDLPLLQEMLVTHLDNVRSLMKEIEMDIPTSKMDVITKAYDRLGALLSRSQESCLLLHVEELTKEVLANAVVHRGNYL